MSDCIFCKIIAGEIPSRIAYEDERVLAFYDIAPAAKTHIVVIPKRHMASFDEIGPDTMEDVSAVLCAIPKLAASLGLADNYRVISNCGANVGQSVRHLHFHLLSNNDEPLPARLV